MISQLVSFLGIVCAFNCTAVFQNGEIYACPVGRAIQGTVEVDAGSSSVRVSSSKGAATGGATATNAKMSCYVFQDRASLKPLAQQEDVYECNFKVKADLPSSSLRLMVFNKEGELIAVTVQTTSKQ